MSGRNQFRVKSDGGWTEFGGYMAAKVRKLDEQFQEKKNNLSSVSSLFENIAIYVNGYTSPTADELKTLMAQHGGVFHIYYSSSYTTHVITTNLTRAKAKELRPGQKIVTPDWIVDSIKAKTLLPIQSYIVAEHGVGQNQLKLETFSRQSTDKPSYSKQPANVSSNNQESTDIASKSSNLLATTDGNFVADFYAHSRLHFLSTWKTKMTDFVRHLVNGEVKLEGRDEILQLGANINAKQNSSASSRKPSQWIMHIDMDCFFVSVGLLSSPHLRGLPVAVTHHINETTVEAKLPSGPSQHLNKGCNKEKHESVVQNKELSTLQCSESTSTLVPSYSEIASCSYEAREKGLKNGMFYGKAKQLCPNLVAIPYDFDAYKRVSKQLYTILCSYTHIVEAVSCDEALIDVSSLVEESRLSPYQIAAHIRSKIEKVTGCTATAGLGNNIVLARIATKIGKPNGQHMILLDEAELFLTDQSIKILPGVGRATTSNLSDIEVFTCGDLQKISEQVLKKKFGNKIGLKLYHLCRGIDQRKVCLAKDRKSVSVDINYGIRLTTTEETNTFLKNLATEVSKRLTETEMLATKIRLKVMIRHPDAPNESVKFGGHGMCNTVSKCQNLEATNNSKIIGDAAIQLLSMLKVKPCYLRGVGIQMFHLKSTLDADLKKETIKKFIPTRKGPIHTKFSGVESDYSSKEFCKKKDFMSSFLSALPVEVRREVKQDIVAQRKALHFSTLPQLPEQDCTVNRSNCGPTFLASLKSGDSCSMVKRWIEESSNSAPVQEDIDDLKQFMSTIVLKRNLECAYAVMRTFKRSLTFVKEHADICNSWNEAYDITESYLQNLVKNMYDIKLNIPVNFQSF